MLCKDNDAESMLQADNLVEDLADFKDADVLLAEVKDIATFAKAVDAETVTAE